MVDPRLRRAVVGLDLGLRRLPFRDGVAVVSGRKIDLKHPIDLDGNEDANYLVVTFPHDLPPFWLHRQVRSLETYARELARLKVPSEAVLDWARCLAKIELTREMPWTWRVLRQTLRLLRPVFWISAVVVHLREAGGLLRLGERFGSTNLSRPDGCVVWLHAASLGEVKQLRDVIEKLQAEPEVTVVVTTFTASSAAWLVDTCPQTIHQYAPIDTAGCVSRFLKHWRPDTLIVAENELWPEMIIQTAEAGLLLMQLGARPSRTRRRFARSAGFLLNHFTTITCMTQNVRAELIGCGVSPERIVLCPDVRKATPRLQVDDVTRQELARQIGQRMIWVAASTHESDINIVLDAHVLLRSSGAPLLIIAPRHPRDAHAVRCACHRRGFLVAQRSRGEPVAEDTDVYLADSFGELGAFFSMTRIVYLGGGFGGEGGHNPYEPAAFGCALLSGPRVDNFEHAFKIFRDDNLASFVETSEQLSCAIKALWAAGRFGAEGPKATLSGQYVYPAADIVISQTRTSGDQTHSVQGTAS